MLYAQPSLELFSSFAKNPIPTHAWAFLVLSKYMMWLLKMNAPPPKQKLFITIY